MAAPTKVWMILPVLTTTAVDTTRYETFEEAEKACVKFAAANSAAFMIMEATHYADDDSFTTSINSTIIATI